MNYGEQVLRSYSEAIEVKFLRAIRRGWTDPAVIIDMKDQERQRRSFAEQQGVDVKDIQALVGLVFSGDRKTLAQTLNDRYPGNQAAAALGTEIPPEGHYPVLIITDQDQAKGKSAIHFFYRPKPEIPTDAPPTAMLCEGRVTEITLYFEPMQQVEFRVSGIGMVLVAGPQYLLTLKLGDHVFVAYRFDGTEKAAVVDMLRCGPDKSISQEHKDAFRHRLGITFPPTEEEF